MVHEKILETRFELPRSICAWLELCASAERSEVINRHHWSLNYHVDTVSLPSGGAVTSAVEGSGCHRSVDAILGE